MAGQKQLSTVLQMKKITKIYPNGVVANKGVTFAARSGEIHGIVGENGAGKTTLMKVLMGLEQPDSGHILIKGKQVTITSPAQAIEHKIAMAHQHLSLIPSLTVAENIVLGREPKRGIWFGRQKAEQICTDLGKRYGLFVDPKSKISDLSVGLRQKVEILKALYREPDVLVLDEPTSNLDPQETKELLVSLALIRQTGRTIIFISHRLDEVKNICDRITVMVQGQVIGTVDAKDMTSQDISRLMMGRSISPVPLRRERPVGLQKDVVVSVKNLSLSQSGKRILNNVSFEVRTGEILGIAGIEGNGQEHLVKVLTGLVSGAVGEAEICGQNAINRRPREIRSFGLSYVPQHKLGLGAVPIASILENIISATYNRFPIKKGLFLNWKAAEDFARVLALKFDIRISCLNDPLSTLSGGNIQKLIVAREFSAKPKVVVVERFTQGIDVGGVEVFHEFVKCHARNGLGILLLTTDLSEAIKFSTRLCVMYRGEIVAVFDRPDEISEETLWRYMLGLQRQKPCGQSGSSVLSEGKAQ